MLGVPANTETHIKNHSLSQSCTMDTIDSQIHVQYTCLCLVGGRKTGYLRRTCRRHTEGFMGYSRGLTCSLQIEIGADGWPLAVTLRSSSGENSLQRQRQRCKNKQMFFLALWRCEAAAASFMSQFPQRPLLMWTTHPMSHLIAEAFI